MDIQEIEEFLLHIGILIDTLQGINEDEFDIETRQMGEDRLVEGDKFICQFDYLEGIRPDTEAIEPHEDYKRKELTRPLHELIEELTFIEAALTANVEEFKKKGWI
jgi:hypothetical protein